MAGLNVEDVDRYKGLIFGAVARIVRIQDAPDVCQNVYLNVLRSGHTYDGSSSFSTWLHRVATNAAIDHVRIRRDAMSRAVLHDTPVLERMAGAYETDYNTPERREFLYKCVDALPPRDRELMRMWLDEMPYEEIAARSGMPEGSIKSRIHRSKRKVIEEARRRQGN
jgi:RNA polymerase sigma-70 factor (ECF subfamily)